MATTAELQAYAADAARRNGVPVNAFLWQIGAESGWDPKAQNPKSSAGGIAQFIDTTAQHFGINKWDPKQALDAAAKYDAQLYKQTGDWETVMERYGTLAHSPEGSSKRAEFNAALNKDIANSGTETSVYDKILSGLDFVNPYKQAMKMIDEGSANLTGDPSEDGLISKTIKAITGNISFVVLGIVIIALAALSNQQVRTIAKKAVTKGRA